MLEIEFSSAIEYAWDQEKQLGHRPRSYENPMNMVRKMACSFGWDWGPDLQTVGIWKQVRLERWRVVRATQTRTLATVLEDGTGRVEVHMDLDWRAPHIDDEHPALTLHAQISGGHQAVEATVSVALGAPTAVIVIDVPEAPLWWPVGYGEHPLSDLAVTLRNHDAEVGRYERRIGFRTVELNTQPDQYGTPFTLRINGHDIFIKGANWIPNDHLLTRITREHLEARADQALAANMNLLRVWGGDVEFTRTTFSGDLLATERVGVTADARAVARVTVPANLLAVGDAGTEVLVAKLDGERALHYFEEFKNLALEPHPFEVSAFERDGRVVVAVRASGLVADLAIMADRIHSGLTVNDQLVTLLAGEEAEFELQPYAAGAAGAVPGVEAPDVSEILAAVQEALADPEREHTLVRAINTIRV